MTMFVETKNLSKNSVGGSYSSGSGSGYWLLAGNYVYSRGAIPYKAYTGSDVYDVDGDGNKAPDESIINNDPDDYIDYDERLFILIGPINDRIHVAWKGKNGKHHEAYVNIDDVREEPRRR
jgi:hypothetical protein